MGKKLLLLCKGFFILEKAIVLDIILHFVIIKTAPICSGSGLCWHNV